jgi:hypothetical protein
MTVDATGTGKSFLAGTVSKNGQAVRICSLSIVHREVSHNLFLVAFIVRFGGYNRVFGFGDHVHWGQEWKPVPRCMLSLFIILKQLFLHVTSRSRRLQDSEIVWSFSKATGQPKLLKFQVPHHLLAQPATRLRQLHHAR